MQVKTPRKDAIRPIRPSLPPLFILGTSAYFASYIFLSAARTLDSKLIVLILASSIVVLVIIVSCAIARTQFRKSPVFQTIVGVLAGIALASYGALTYFNESSSIGETSSRSGVVELLEDAKAGPYSKDCKALLKTDNGKRFTVNLRIGQKLDSEGSFRYGDRYFIDFALKPVDISTSDYSWSKGVTATATATSLKPVGNANLAGVVLYARNSAINGFENLALNFDDDSRRLSAVGLLEAISCGYRVRLFEDALYDDVKRCGLAHLVAVSGAHLVIVVGLLGVFLKATHVSKRLTMIFSTGFLLAYLVLAGCPASAIRASIMCELGMLSFVGKRRSSSLSALGICAIAMIAADPFVALSASFLLSYASTTGIVLFGSYATYFLRTMCRRLPDFVESAVALTISSNFVCLPISISLFSQMPIVAILANIVATPFFPVLCGLSLVAGLCFAIAPLAANLLTSMALLVGSVFNSIVMLIARLPYSCIPVSLDAGIAFALIAVSSFILWKKWPRLQIRTSLAFGAMFFVALILIVFVSPLFAGTEIVMLDVGQGDSFLLRDRGECMLIDTGTNDSLLREGLARHGVRKLDAVLITHPDDDHYGSLESLRSYIDVERVIIASGTSDSDDTSCNKLLNAASSISSCIQEVKAGDCFAFGAYRVSILWPNKLSSEPGNADSVCCEVSADVDGDEAPDCKALFTGDLEIEQLESICKQYETGYFDILKVPHHGSKTGLNDDLAKRIGARAGLISVGEGNRYGHPNVEVLNALNSSGTRIFKTDEQGDVSCKIGRNAIRFDTQR